MEISQLKGRIGADDTKTLYLKFSLKKETLVKGEITINIRGGRTLKLPFSANVIVPNVSILEEGFDFGNITTLGKLYFDSLVVLTHTCSFLFRQSWTSRNEYHEHLSDSS